MTSKRLNVKVNPRKVTLNHLYEVFKIKENSTLIE